MLIILQLTTVDKRLKLIVGMATGSERGNPRLFRWGLCGHNVFLRSDCVIAQRQRALPLLSLLGFFFGTDRTPSDSKSLHGLRGGKHRRVATPDPAVQPFSEGLGNTFAAAVRQCGHG